MSNYANLKSAIQSVIKTNGNNEITGQLLQNELLAMITTLGYGYQFVGVASPDTVPGTPDAKVFYIAYTPGTYTNFGGIAVTGLCVLKYVNGWTKEDIPVSGGGGGTEFIVEPTDLTLVSGTPNKLKFADRPYNSLTPDILGYKILRKDLTFAAQVTEENTIYEIRDEFTLASNFVMPSNSILKFNGGAINGGGYNLQLSSNSRIVGNGEKLINVRLVISGTQNAPLKNVFITGVILDANKNVSIENVIFGEYAQEVIIENVIVKDYYHKYRSGEEHSQYSVIYLSHFSNLSISNLQAKNGVYPNGLMIVWSDNVVISNCVIDDTNNESGVAYEGSTGNIWSNLELFYNTNVVVENTYLKARTFSGSLINCGCKDVIFRDSVFIGGNSVDVGDEWSEDATFVPSNVIIDNCDILNGTDGVKCLVNPNGLDGLCVKNCRIVLNAEEQTNKSIFRVQNVKNFSAINNTTESSGTNLLHISSYTGTARDLGVYLIQGNKITGCTYGVLTADAQSTITVMLLNNLYVHSSNVNAIVDGRDKANMTYVVRGNQFIANGYVSAFHGGDTTITSKSIWDGNYFYSENNTINESYRSISIPVNAGYTIVKDNFFSGVSILIDNSTSKKTICGNFFERDGRIVITNCDNAVITGNNLGSQYIRNISTSVMGSNMLIRDNICRYSFFNKYVIGNNAENLIGVKAFGTTAQRPATKIDGFRYYDTTLGRLITWNGSAWVDAYGDRPDILKKGPTADRQSAVYVGAGSTYFDTDLGKMIVSNGTAWVNMDGSAL